MTQCILSNLSFDVPTNVCISVDTYSIRDRIIVGRNVATWGFCNFLIAVIPVQIFTCISVSPLSATSRHFIHTYILDVRFLRISTMSTLLGATHMNSRWPAGSVTRVSRLLLSSQHQLMLNKNEYRLSHV